MQLLQPFLSNKTTTDYLCSDIFFAEILCETIKTLKESNICLASRRLILNFFTSLYFHKHFCPNFKM